MTTLPMSTRTRPWLSFSGLRTRLATLESCPTVAAAIARWTTPSMTSCLLPPPACGGRCSFIPRFRPTRSETRPTAGLTRPPSSRSPPSGGVAHRGGHRGTPAHLARHIRPPPGPANRPGSLGEMLLFALDRIDSLSNIATHSTAESPTISRATSTSRPAACSLGVYCPMPWTLRASIGSCSLGTIRFTARRGDRRRLPGNASGSRGSGEDRSRQCRGALRLGQPASGVDDQAAAQPQGQA